MIETIRKAVIRGVFEKFALPVYGQCVSQGGKRPCFTVEIKEVRQKKLLGRRASLEADAEVCYYHGGGAETAAETAGIAEGLCEALLFVGETETFAASRMKYRQTDEGLLFTACYGCHVMLTEEEAAGKTELMQRLEHNGRKAAGWNADSEIYKKTADGKQDLSLQP